MTRNLNIKVIVDEDTLWSAVMGSGWETFSWWRSIEFRRGATWESAGDGGTLRVVADDPDGDQATTRDVTFDILQVAIEAAALHGLMGQIDWTDPDIDADLGDVIIQYAVYGEVVYS